jgi:predicted nucleotide-binding protein
MKLGRSFIEQQVGSHAEYELLQKEYRKWNVFNTELLKQLFTTEDLANEYSASTISPMIIRGYHDESLGKKVANLKEQFDRKIHRLDSIVDRLELYSVASHASNIQEVAPTAPQTRLETNKVFIVHGRDDAAKANLEAFVREIGLEPIVLHRQADGGLTVIEKFEKHSDVGYAFILLTPDELAYLASESSKPEAARAVERRARPNVIFEWGYFVGKLGRPRVCCISTGSVDLPSDMHGLVTKRYQSSVEEVAYSIIKDLRAAGYKV